MIVRHDIALTSGAEFSPCERYRYRLRRCFSGSVLEPARNPIVFCMCNPSTADALVNDPTVRRCVGWAAAWGYSDVLVVNMFALRATDPDELLRADDPVGPENDAVLGSIPRDWPVVAAWGAHKATLPRAARVISVLGRPLLCLRELPSGAPGHPLYLPKNVRPVPWEPRRVA